MPFHPMLGFAGTDYEKIREDFRTVTDPYSGNEICVVPAIRPDWAVIHAIRADVKGNVICSALESDRLAVFAASRAIVTVEEVVPEESLIARPGEIFLSALHIEDRNYPDGRHRCWTISAQTRSRTTDRSKTTGGRTSDISPFRISTQRVRGYRVASHSMVSILTAKGHRKRRWNVWRGR